MMRYTLLLPALLGFLISVMIGPIMIPFLKRLHIGQYVREDGPSTHLKKNGTPTMGGIIFLISIILTCSIYIGYNTEILPILFVTVGYGIIGFLDDYIKIVLKRSLGLRAWQKLLLQIVITGIFGYYINRYTEVGSTILVPFTGGIHAGIYLELGVLFLPFMMLTMIGTVNGSNFTDGIDGLATSVTLLISIFFSIVALGTGNEVSPITCAVAGSLLGFLVFNVYPAKVIMGDTGSLALGGFVASTAFVLRMPLFIAIVAIIYLIEVMSVIIQVGYFKISKGKRLFKMAPIHHHFELSGWPETKVVAVFSIITTVGCLIALLGV